MSIIYVQIRWDLASLLIQIDMYVGHCHQLLDMTRKENFDMAKINLHVNRLSEGSLLIN